MCEICKALSRRAFLKSALIGGAAVGLGTFDSNMLFAQSQNIKFSTHNPPVSIEVKAVWTPMLEEIKKRSAGKIGYTMFAGGALGKGPEHYDIVAKGLSDMGFFTSTWTPGRFPLTDVLSLAVWVEGKDVATEIGNAVYNRALKNEYKNVKLLQINGCIQSFIWTKKPVAKMADLKGMKLRSPGGHQTNYIKSLGAEPVFMPLGDVYMAIETGTVDGIVTCAPQIIAYKLHEVAKSALVLTLGCVAQGVVMNMNAWNKLPADQKKVIEDVCTNPYKVTGGLDSDDYKVIMNDITKAGVKLVDLPKADAEQWYDKFRDVTRKWASDLEAKGLPAKKVVAIMNEECEKRKVNLVACPPEMKKI